MKSMLIYALLFLAPVLLHAQDNKEFGNKQEMEQALILARNGKADKALEVLSALRAKTAERDSFHLFAVMLSIEMNNQVDRFADAIKDCEELIRLKPEAEVDLQQIIGRQKQYLGDFDGALVAFRRIIALKPSDKIVYSNLASTYNYEGKYKEAIQALNSNPNKERMPKEFYHYAVAYYQLSAMDSAQSYIDKYLDTDEGSNSHTGYMYGALIYDKQNDKATACNYITAANDILVEKKVEDRSAKASEDMKATQVYKLAQKEVDKIKELKTQLCGK